MAAILWSDVEALAPSLESVTYEAQAMVLAVVNSCLNVSMWGGEDAPKLKLARVYLACHMVQAAVQGEAGTAGPVTHEMVDRLSTSYAQPGGGMSFDSLDSTAFGKMYRLLARTTKARSPVVL